jgi:DNA polymerase-4
MVTSNGEREQAAQRRGVTHVPRPREPILHVDLDAFYASVEVLKDPSLAGKPVVVGGAGSRGVVASASYEARRYGIHSAMPGIRARRLCPDLIFLPHDFDAYRAHSNRFREVLLSFTPLVEPISLDEAFLDVGGATMLFGQPVDIARRVRELVRSEVGVNCSVGVAPNKFIAKVASDRAKPDGMLVVEADAVQDFLDPLPVRALWGVGEKTVEILDRLAVRTVSDLRETPTSVLARLLGDQHATHLHELSTGRDERAVIPYEPPRSVSHEETFGNDLDDPEVLLNEVLALSQKVGARLRKSGYRARTVTLKARFANFTTITRSRTLTDPTDLGSDVYEVASSLFKGLPGARSRFRLLGVSATGLVAAGAEQLALLRGSRWGDVERAVDRIQTRFGEGSALPAALLDHERARGSRRRSASKGPGEPRSSETSTEGARVPIIESSDGT